MNLHQLIDEAISNLRPLADEKNAEIHCELEAVNQVLMANKGYLLIVLTNVIENALKYTTHPKIQVSTFNDNGNIFVAVKDNGKGIEKKIPWEKFLRNSTVFPMVNRWQQEDSALDWHL